MHENFWIPHELARHVKTQKGRKDGSFWKVAKAEAAGAYLTGFARVSAAKRPEDDLSSPVLPADVRAIRPVSARSCRELPPATTRLHQPRCDPAPPCLEFPPARARLYQPHCATAPPCREFPPTPARLYQPLCATAPPSRESPPTTARLHQSRCLPLILNWQQNLSLTLNWQQYLNLNLNWQQYLSNLLHHCLRT